MRAARALTAAQRKKQTFAGAAIALAVVLDLIATFQIGSGRPSRSVSWLFGIAAGVMIGAVVVLLASRKAK
jgi:hypothetical protein